MLRYYITPINLYLDSCLPISKCFEVFSTNKTNSTKPNTDFNPHPSVNSVSPTRDSLVCERTQECWLVHIILH